MRNLLPARKNELRKKEVYLSNFTVSKKVLQLTGDWPMAEVLHGRICYHGKLSWQA